MNVKEYMRRILIQIKIAGPFIYQRASLRSGNALDQRSSTCCPRDACGPRKHFMWPLHGFGIAQCWKGKMFLPVRNIDIQGDFEKRTQ
jgi:hypothetical protein